LTLNFEKYDWLTTHFPKFISTIFSTNIFQFVAVEKENKFPIGPKGFLFSSEQLKKKIK